MELQKGPGRIWAEDAGGKLLAEVTFPASGGVANINRTFVDGSLRGQGMAGQLLVAATDQIRGEGLRAVPTCSYAKKWFEEHPEASDLLAPQP